MLKIFWVNFDICTMNQLHFDRDSNGIPITQYVSKHLKPGHANNSDVNCNAQFNWGHLRIATTFIQTFDNFR
jgi:hypothetical protein